MNTQQERMKRRLEIYFKMYDIGPHWSAQKESC